MSWRSCIPRPGTLDARGASSSTRAAPVSLALTPGKR